MRTPEGLAAVVKLHRPLEPVDVSASARRLASAQAAQSALADAGVPCPRPIGAPTVVGELVATAETPETAGGRADGREGRIRTAMARVLARQVAVLEGRSWPELTTDLPAWADVSVGAWPRTHDPIFDFSRPVPGAEWIDDLADRSAATARSWVGEPVVAHGDWTPGNVRFQDDRIVASYDWDSLVQATEPVVVGIAAASHGEGDRSPVPHPSEVAEYVVAYEQACGRGFDDAGRTAVAAAVTYCLAYNARCELALTGMGITPDEQWAEPLRRWQHAYAEALRS